MTLALARRFGAGPRAAVFARAAVRARSVCDLRARMGGDDCRPGVAVVRAADRVAGTRCPPPMAGRADRRCLDAPRLAGEGSRARDPRVARAGVVVQRTTRTWLMATLGPPGRCGLPGAAHRPVAACGARRRASTRWRWQNMACAGWSTSCSGDAAETRNASAHSRGWWQCDRAALLWVALVWACGAATALAALFVLGGVAALLPVLPLASSGTQYGYGFAAMTAAVTSPRPGRRQRMGTRSHRAVAVLSVWHGVASCASCDMPATCRRCFRRRWPTWPCTAMAMRFACTCRELRYLDLHSPEPRVPAEAVS